MNDQERFFDEHWPAMKAAMEEGGPEAVRAFIAGFDDPLERRVLYFNGHGAFNAKEWAGKDLLATAAYVKLGIAEMLAQSAASRDDEERDGLKDLANIMSFNMAADLADCWPGDDAPRDERHFELGLAAAEDCLRWRTELKKGPNPFAIAWWVKGMHELSLTRTADALASFTEYRKYAVEHAAGEKLDASIGASGHWSVLLAEGYLAIGLCSAGDAAGPERLKAACDALIAAQEAQPDEKGNLEFCLAQIRKVADTCLAA